MSVDKDHWLLLLERPPGRSAPRLHVAHPSRTDVPRLKTPFELVRSVDGELTLTLAAELGYRAPLPSLVSTHPPRLSTIVCVVAC